jgi:hypothetical protein
MRDDHKTVGLTLLYISNTLQKLVDITVCDFTPAAGKSLSCISWELRFVLVLTMLNR